MEADNKKCNTLDRFLLLVSNSCISKALFFEYLKVFPGVKLVSCNQHDKAVLEHRYVHKSTHVGEKSYEYAMW